MALTSVSVYELSRLGPPQQPVRRRSNSTKVRRKDAELGSVDRKRNPKRNQIQPQHNESITITYMGRPRSPSVDLPTSPPIPSVIRQRRSSSTVAKKLPQSASNPSFLRKQGSSSSLSNGLWTDCIEVVNEIGVMAKMESRKIRRLRMAVYRRVRISDDEEMVLTASRALSKCHGWTLDTCHDYLPVIIDNIISMDTSNRIIAAEGLAAIADSLGERLVKFAGMNSHRIGVDIAAEERSEKAKACIQLLRSVVRKRDWYYRHLDVESIDRLDATMERLKSI